MKVIHIASQIFFLFILLLVVSCDNDDVIKDGPADPDQPTEENTIAKYSFTFRGEVASWTDEKPNVADFWLHQVPMEQEGYYSLGIGMAHLASSPSQSNGVSFTRLISNAKLSTGKITPGTYSLVHIHTYDDVKDCIDNPQGCVGVGTAYVAGTEPAEDIIPGVDNDIHAETGTLTITNVIITQNEDGIIKGLVSGNFTLQGINTNASKPNAGSASGSFENAPFSTLAF